MTTYGFSESIHLDVPADEAFAYLADPSTARVIDPAIREYRPDTTPMHEGTRNLIRMRMWGLPVRATSVVREWEPGRRMVMENIKPSRPVRAVATHSFMPDGDAACTYTWTVDVIPSGPFGALAARAFARFMHGNARAQQQRVKAEVERRFP
jgi:hypothetical protein